MEQYKNHPNAMPTPAQACNKTTRLTYTSPTITSVEFAVEHCFASEETLPNSTGLQFFVKSQNTMDQTDNVEQKWNTASSDWF